MVCLDAVIGAWLGAHAAAAREDSLVPYQDQNAPDLVAIMVDGKAVRGATDADGNQVHLLAAATHLDALVLGQVEVGAKSNKIPQFAPLLDGTEHRSHLGPRQLGSEVIS